MQQLCYPPLSCIHSSWRPKASQLKIKATPISRGLSDVSDSWPTPGAVAHLESPADFVPRGACAGRRGGVVVWWCGGGVVWWRGGVVGWWWHVVWFGGVWWCGGVVVILSEPLQSAPHLISPAIDHLI